MFSDDNLTTFCPKSNEIFLLQRLFTNYTEWNCDVRTGSGIEPILFEPKTLAWRIPTIFIVTILIPIDILYDEIVSSRDIKNIHVKAC